MEGWILAATIVTALAAVATAATAISLAWSNRQLVRIGQEQARQGLEALRNSYRPLLTPEGELPLVQRDGHHSFDFQQEGCGLTLRNVGAGVALNVRAVLHEPRPRETPSFRTSRQVLRLEGPLPSGEREHRNTQRAKTFVGPSVTIKGDREGYSLYAPPLPTRDELAHKYMLGAPIPYAVARLSVTYHDISGRKHASVFDYVASTESINGTEPAHWALRALVPGIQNDLDELDAEAQALLLAGVDSTVEAPAIAEP